MKKAIFVIIAISLYLTSFLQSLVNASDYIIAVNFQYPFGNGTKATFDEYGSTRGFSVCVPSWEGRHLAIDVNSPTGTKIYAAANGKVVLSDNRSVGGYGNCGGAGYVIVIEHELNDGSKVCSLYGHIQNATYNKDKEIGLITNGSVVEKGQYIGTIADYWQDSNKNGICGDAGDINADHLHFGIRKGAFNDSEWKRYIKGYSYYKEDPQGNVEWFEDVDAEPEEFCFHEYSKGYWTNPVDFIESHKSPSIDINDGLVAYYPFNGNANDESGNGNNGTVHEATFTTDRFGNPNNACYFDGVDDLIEIENTDDVFTFLDEFSLSAWVKPNTASYDQRTSPIIWKVARNQLNEDNYFLAYGDDRTNSPKFTVGRERSSDDHDFRAASDLHSEGYWYHLVGIYDGEALRIYVDSTLEGNSNIGEFTPYSGSASLRIGNILNTNHGNAGVFNGKIDDIRIYNRALSEFEINKLYDNSYVEPSPGYSTTEENVSKINSDETHWWDFITEKIQKLKVTLNWISSLTLNASTSLVGRPLDEATAANTFSIKIYKPDGTLYQELQSATSPIELVIPNAEVGQWRFEVTAIEMPSTDNPYVLAIGEEIPCPDCSGITRTIENETFLSNCLCECNCSESLTFGEGVVVEAGANLTVKAPKVNIKNGTHFEPGANVTIKQE